MVPGKELVMECNWAFQRAYSKAERRGFHSASMMAGSLETRTAWNWGFQMASTKAENLETLKAVN
jgi:hypothetical protein